MYECRIVQLRVCHSPLRHSKIDMEMVISFHLTLSLSTNGSLFWLSYLDVLLQTEVSLRITRILWSRKIQVWPKSRVHAAKLLLHLGLNVALAWELKK